MKKEQLSQKSELADRASDRLRLTKRLKSSVEEFENLSSTLCQMLNGDDDLGTIHILHRQGFWTGYLFIAGPSLCFH